MSIKSDSSIELFSILKTVRDQISTMNEMTMTIVKQSNENYIRIEKKVDENNLRLDGFQSEIRDMVTAVTQLSIEMRNKIQNQDNEIEKIESSFGHLAGESCETTIKQFCESMKKEEPLITKLIIREKDRNNAINIVKNSFFENIGNSIPKIAIGIFILLFLGITVFFGIKIDELNKKIPVITNIIKP